MKYDSNRWHNIHQRRETHKRQGKKWRLSRWQAVVAGSYVLLLVAFWGIFSIYGPVLLAEAGYQVKRATNVQPGEQAGFWNLLTPNLSFELVPESFASGYGLVIPKIFVQEEVVVNVNANDEKGYMQALQLGIAHAQGTAIPGDGGLGYYFAHSSGMRVLQPQQKAMFYLLGKLETGDEVYIYKDMVKYTYRVVDKQVVSADDVSFLDYMGDEERIVLQTCWPIGTSLQRLLVTAERVS